MPKISNTLCCNMNTPNHKGNPTSISKRPRSDSPSSLNSTPSSPSCCTELTSVVKENKLMKENILDLQARSMRDNLVFTGIPDQTPDDPEKLIKDFMTKQLKLPAETVQSITFHRVHRIRSQQNNNRPRPIITKF
ncbi:CinA-like protein [Labeo rohita]|uniref:CinA-like protein n=1 Tax=Labeo rohita TaxID=84645 RepID=A0ABQ8L117_LABRO|nr:CinA-like protein [Labeo rohita]